MQVMSIMNNSTNLPDDTANLRFPTVPLVVILVILSCATVLGNSLVCLAIYSRPALRHVTYLPFFSLAVADLLVGFVAMPTYIMKKVLADETNSAVCDTFRFSYFLTGYASILSLCVISVERLIVVKSPLTFTSIVTHRRVTLALIFIWFDALVISALPFIPWPGVELGECHYSPTHWWSIMVIVTNVIVPFLFIVTCYIYIYGIARSHARKILSERNSISCRAKESNNLRANRTVLIVIGVFVISWFPSSFYYFLQGTCPTCFPSSFYSLQSLVNALVKVLTFSSSFVNPLIYCWRNLEFRNAFKIILFRKTRRIRQT